VSFVNFYLIFGHHHVSCERVRVGGYCEQYCSISLAIDS